MKYLPFTFACTLLLACLSCKKDADLEPRQQLEQQPFFVRGEFYDTRDTSVRTFDWDMQLNEEELVVPGVASATGATDEHKYLVSVMSFGASSWLYDAPFSNEADATGPFAINHKSTIGLKFVSDRPASEYDQAFSKSELESLIQPGRYTYGNAPSQVELVAIRPTGELRMFLPSMLLDHSYNQFEVLSVEDYYFDENRQEEPTQGKIVHFRGRVALEYAPAYVGTVYFLSVEGKFFFAYE